MLFQCSVIDASISLKSILLTGLIRDENNKKMSKSVGNVVDPDAIIEEYGADALRATLISGSPNGEDLIFKKERLIYNRNFINKIWNANNLVIKNNENNINFKKIDFINSWIINELHKCIHQYINNMEKYNFSIIWKEVVNFS
ncbi:MAG: class I tRNA ligase family protein [Rickettsiales bacterium]|nr:class I tRNA ligase family protein [Rickettsiales bacterium]